MGDEKALAHEPSALETVTGVARMFGVELVYFQFSPKAPLAVDAPVGSRPAETRIELVMDGRTTAVTGTDAAFAARMAVLTIVGRVLGGADGWGFA